MPYAVARHCSASSSCPNYAVVRGRCADHAPQRGSSTQQHYGADWRRARISYLLANPYCVCEADCCPSGCGLPADTVDHITPHKGDMELFWHRGNWQSLTSTCHNRKTARENGWG